MIIGGLSFHALGVCRNVIGSCLLPLSAAWPSIFVGIPTTERPTNPPHQRFIPLGGRPQSPTASVRPRTGPRVSGELQLCRDPDDDLILETAVLGRARYAVSRDDDLKGDRDLVANMIPMGVEVLTVQHFLERLEAGLL